MEPILQVKDLTHTYGAGTPFQRSAVEHMSFDVNEGEFLGIIGHTGSGKSTLIQHLNGLLQPTAGEILLRGKNIWAGLIGPDGAQLGIVSSREAFAKAQEAGLDLVKIAPQAKPPVCKIIDYGKYRYELSRKEKEAKKKQKTIDIKEVRLSPNIDTNDLKTKVNAARKFLSKGDRVKVTLRFRGREMAHMSNSKHVLDDFAELLTDIAVVEKAPKIEGRSMTMFLSEKR